MVRSVAMPEHKSAYVSLCVCMWATELNLSTPAEDQLFVGCNPDSMSMFSLSVHIGKDAFEELHSYRAAMSTSLSMEIRSLKSDQLSDDRYKLR